MGGWWWLHFPKVWRARVAAHNIQTLFVSLQITPTHKHAIHPITANTPPVIITMEIVVAAATSLPQLASGDGDDDAVESRRTHASLHPVNQPRGPQHANMYTFLLLHLLLLFLFFPFFFSLYHKNATPGCCAMLLFPTPPLRFHRQLRHPQAHVSRT